MKRLNLKSSGLVTTAFATLLFGFASCDTDGAEEASKSNAKSDAEDRDLEYDRQDDATGRSVDNGDAASPRKLDQAWDAATGGSRLVLAYHADTTEFVGTIKNTTEALAKAVRVTVRLSNGKMLGPTPQQNLLPGEEIPIKLSAKGETFETWTPHVERDK